MNDDSPATRTHNAWLTSAKVLSMIGGLATSAFLVWWFVDVSGHCGVVRFYEQTFGVFILGAWSVGTLPPLLIARGRQRGARARVLGSSVAVLVNAVAVVALLGWLLLRDG